MIFPLQRLLVMQSAKNIVDDQRMHRYVLSSEFKKKRTAYQYARQRFKPWRYSSFKIDVFL